MGPWLRERQREDELMDDPAIEPDTHRRALAGLGRLNRVARSSAALWRGIRRELPDARSLRVLDLATGSGDVGLGVWSQARRAGRRIDLAGWDRSPVAVAAARARATAIGAPSAFECHDVLRDELPSDYDVIMTSLFLHHLEVGEARALLGRMARAARRLVLVSDLRRDILGYVCAGVACALLGGSRVVRIDGVRSVRAAFTVAEAAELARAAMPGDVQIRTHWPRRYLLSVRT